MDISIGDKEKNLAAMTEAMRQTAQAGAMLTVFPECALPGYCFDSLDESRPFAETIPGPGTSAIAEACRRLDQFAIFGLLELDGDRIFNACVLVGPDGVIGTYRKVHLPFLGIDRFTTPGDRPFAVHEIRGLRVGMNICYDGSFPEASRILALDGADLIVLPTNWPPGSECAAGYAVNTRAMENAVYYMAVDRIGVERGFHFIGQSKICDTSGSTITEAAHADPAILYAEIDPARARNKHLVRVPQKHEIDRLKDRRPELYGRLLEK